MQQMMELRQRGLTDEQILEQIATEQLAGTGIEVPKAPPPDFASHTTPNASRGNVNMSVKAEN